jgi:hypothetical protein
MEKLSNQFYIFDPRSIAEETDSRTRKFGLDQFCPPDTKL